jgi:hypothetical protein
MAVRTVPHDGSTSEWLSRRLAKLWQSFAGLLDALRLGRVQQRRRLQRGTKQAVAVVGLLLLLLLLLGLLLLLLLLLLLGLAKQAGASILLLLRLAKQAGAGTRLLLLLLRLSKEAGAGILLRLSRGGAEEGICRRSGGGTVAEQAGLGRVLLRCLLLLRLAKETASGRSGASKQGASLLLSTTQISKAERHGSAWTQEGATKTQADTRAGCEGERE